ncbi:MAG: sensor histidine kinase [Chloroflexota bacterium]
MSRAATIIFSLSISAFLYTVLVTAIRRFFQVDPAETTQPIGLLLILVPAVLFEPLRKRVQRLFDNLIYGGWYDFQTVVSSVADSLEVQPTIQSFAEALSEAIHNAMRVRWAGVLMQDRQTGRLLPASVAGEPSAIDWFRALKIEQKGAVYEELLALREPVLGSAISNQELKQAGDLFRSNRVQLLVPLTTELHRGVILLGKKFGGLPFDEADIKIMRIVLRQANMAMANAVLVDKLRLEIKENEAYQRQFGEIREAERKRIAREIHDQLIQSLVSFKYQLAEIQADLDLHPESIQMNLNASELQTDLAGLIQVARQICYDLRPPTLDLGLVPGLRSVINKFVNLTGVQVIFEPSGDLDTRLDDGMMLCFLRCLQEGLKNIEKHAQANCVEIKLEIRRDEHAMLQLRDNGVGFVLPNRLGELMQEQHYGMVGMRERVSLLGGEFAVVSAPQQGTQLTLQIPIVKKTAVSPTNTPPNLPPRKPL